MEQKREIDVNDVRKLVGKLLTIVEATVLADNQKATKQLVIQTIWQVFNVVGAWKADDELDADSWTGKPVKL